MVLNQIQLKDIIISARQESHRMRHYYLGVEHLFIALLEIRGGLTSNILSEHGLSNEYVIDAIRRKTGKGSSKHRLWPNLQETPRSEMVMSIAQDIASTQGRQNIQERDLLVAILEEKDNIPTRVLRALDLNIEKLRQEANTRQASRPQTHSFIQLDFPNDFEGELDPDQLSILRRMFHGYSKVRIEAQLTGGYTGSLLLVVTPFELGKRKAALVVKIGPADTILDEAMRYERYVKGTLPPLTARLEDKPTAPDTSELAGLKYTFLGNASGNPTNMRGIIHQWTGPKIGKWLHEHLYTDFGENWWKQNRSFRFEAWFEYDWLLPPVLTLELEEDEKLLENAHIIKFPLKRKRIKELDYGDAVVIENFVVQKVDKENQRIRLALGPGSGSEAARPYQIEIRGIDFEQDTYYRGEIVERIGGTVFKTRDEQLMMAARALKPDFDIMGDKISILNKSMPNPIKAYHTILDMHVDGTLSTIHGDLHLGNILIGPSDSALLIDFALTRDGHTVFDWANLEVSIISESIVPQVPDSWDGARLLINHLVALNNPGRTLSGPPELREALQAIVALREIASQCLANKNRWVEYYVSLSMCALRAMQWETMTLASRRVMFLLAALSMFEIENYKPDSDSETTPSPDPDSTEFDQ
jgi:hypothetical protein